MKYKNSKNKIWEWERAKDGESSFEDVCFKLGMENWPRQSDWKSDVVSGEREFQSCGLFWQRMLVCQKMFEHMEWKEQMNQMIAYVNTECEEKDRLL